MNISLVVLLILFLDYSFAKSIVCDFGINSPDDLSEICKEIQKNGGQLYALAKDEEDKYVKQMVAINEYEKLKDPEPECSDGADFCNPKWQGKVREYVYTKYDLILCQNDLKNENEKIDYLQCVIENRKKITECIQKLTERPEPFDESIDEDICE